MRLMKAWTVRYSQANVSSQSDSEGTSTFKWHEGLKIQSVWCIKVKWCKMDKSSKQWSKSHFKQAGFRCLVGIFLLTKCITFLSPTFPEHFCKNCLCYINQKTNNLPKNIPAGLFLILSEAEWKKNKMWIWNLCSLWLKWRNLTIWEKGKDLDENIWTTFISVL